MKMTWTELTPIISDIAESEGLVAEASFYENSDRKDSQPGYKMPPRAASEALLHELCHQALLGVSKSNAVSGSNAISFRIRKMKKIDADIHEMETCALERLVSVELGLNVSLHRLLEFSIMNFGSYRFMENFTDVLEVTSDCLTKPGLNRLAKSLARKIQHHPRVGHA